MHSGRIVFSQLMDFLPRHEFNKCVRRYQGHYRLRTFSCFDQFLCMAFAQLTYRESLRDIETCLRTMDPKLYHAGIRGNVSRSTLADAYEDFGLELEQTTYILDSTTIALCLSLFPWAHFRKRKGAIKLHTLMDLRGSIPCFICITEGTPHNVTTLDRLIFEPTAFYIMDRGYIDFGRLYRLSQNRAFFVIRAKKNLDYQRRAYRPVDPSTGLRSDQTILLRGPKNSQIYPDPLRRITYFDTETNRRFVFLTNNFILPALTIALLFKHRWQIEIFFKWIKQHLRIKAFYGTSPNAVKTQIWIAISVYVLVAIIKKKLTIDRSLSEIVQILSITLFESSSLLQVLADSQLPKEMEPFSNQSELFNS